MGKRIVRTKRKIATAHIRYRTAETELPTGPVAPSPHSHRLDW